ncbi:MAG: flagellar basal-body rod protein FlgF [Magnetococcales bacterium]|nr:flagellar basal-body rod protein FlgF [Magnetococcales bacterium]
MTVPVYIVSSNMIAQRQKLDMTADNIANSNTVGFKKLGMTFQEVVSRQKAETVGSFTHHNGTFYNFTQGGFERTDNDFDVAIQGAGFFQTERNGQIHLTRNGHFSMNNVGELVTDAGSPVLDANGGPIIIPADSAEILISRDGTISNQNGIVAQLGVVQVADPQKLTRTGEHGYILEDGASIPVENINVVQGFVESSNINPIEETVTLTELNRRYQSTARLVKSLEELEQKAIQNLSRLP